MQTPRSSGLKAQKSIAQGSALGMQGHATSPCKGKRNK